MHIVIARRARNRHRTAFRAALATRLASAFVAALVFFAGPLSTGAAAQSSSRPTEARPATLLVLGDSISAGYGLAEGAGWVPLLVARLGQQRLPYRVVNASISGETTSGGVARIDELLGRVHPAIVIVELGGNDGLRGLPVDATGHNLETIVTRSQKAGAAVLLLGMKLPPNYGRSYTERFAALYPALATKYRTALVPFFFEGLVDRDDLFQADRIHPTAAAQGRLLDNVWPTLAPLLAP